MHFDWRPETNCFLFCRYKILDMNLTWASLLLFFTLAAAANQAHAQNGIEFN
jgi:hypothetical protein